MSSPGISTGFPIFSQPISDPDTGLITPVWRQLFVTLWARTGLAAGSDFSAVSDLANVDFSDHGANEQLIQQLEDLSAIETFPLIEIDSLARRVESLEMIVGFSSERGESLDGRIRAIEDLVLAGLTRGENLPLISGTANQVLVGGSPSAPALSLPQSIAVSSNVQFANVKTASGTIVGAVSGVATTIGAISHGLWLVHAYIANAAASHYAAASVIACSDVGGTGSARVALNGDSILITITISGLDVQVTQNSGANNDVSWSVVRIADL